MTRHTVGFCLSLACTLLVASLAAEAQPLAKFPRIGWLGTKATARRLCISATCSIKRCTRLAGWRDTTLSWNTNG
jgi:hypothetical protein